MVRYFKVNVSANICISCLGKNKKSNGECQHCGKSDKIFRCSTSLNVTKLKDEKGLEDDSTLEVQLKELGWFDQ